MLCYNNIGDSMEKKTHVACGNLISLFLMKPTTVSGLLITITSSTLGSLLPDVDLKDSTTDKLFDRLMTSLITIIVMSILMQYFFNINLYKIIKSYNNLFNYIITICLFIIMSYLGSKTAHRSFTHSILGLFIYTVILSYNFKDNIVIPYFISHLSHILLDLLNMKGVALFYPFKFRFSLKLCESSGSFNQLLFGLFSFCDMFLFVFLMIGINV